MINWDEAIPSKPRRESAEPAAPSETVTPLQIRCGSCATLMQVAGKFAGKKIRCPKCKTVVEAPSPKAPLPEATARERVSARPILDVIVVDSPRRPRREPPRKKRPQPRPANSALPWVLGGVLVASLLLVAVSVAGFFAFRNWVNDLDRQRPFNPPPFAEREFEDKDRFDFLKEPDKKEFEKPPEIGVFDDPPKIPLPKVDSTKLDPAKVDSPKVDPPKIELPKGQRLLEEIPGELRDGHFRAVSALNEEDGQDPVERQRCKVYIVPLEARTQYIVSLSSNQLDAYLRIEDSSRRPIAADDDGGGGLNSQIVFTPAATGDHRIYAGALARGKGGYFLSIRTDGLSPTKLPDVRLPVSGSPAAPLQGHKSNLRGVTVTQLKVPAADKILGDIVWSADGKVFFALTNEGVLSRVSLASFVEEKRLDMERRCGFLALSAEGLLASMIDLQEVWLIDENTLTVKKRLNAPGVYRVLSSPQLKFAVATRGGERHRNPTGAMVLDLVKGEAIGQFDVPSEHARITPDGKYYFAQGGVEQLCGYRIVDGALINHQQTGRIAQNGQSIGVSPDSKYVCLPSGGGNYGMIYATYVYPVENLTRPEFTLTSGAYPTLVAFDPIASLVFTQNADKQLIVYTMTAIKRGEYSLTEQRGIDDEPRQFVPHPQGSKLLVLTEQSLVFVELQK